MDDHHVEVFRKQAARVTGATDPDVVRILEEELWGETAGTDEQAEAAIEEMPCGDDGGSQRPT